MSLFFDHTILQQQSWVVSVFDVGISFSVYRSVFFQVRSVFVVGFQNIALSSLDASNPEELSPVKYICAHFAHYVSHRRPTSVNATQNINKPVMCVSG